jgi:hypothetical protein
MVGFCKPACYHEFMKSDLRISIKDYKRNKNLKIQLVHTLFPRPASYGVTSFTTVGVSGGNLDKSVKFVSKAHLRTGG